MSVVLHLPHAIRIKVAQHLACIERAGDLHALELAQERARFRGRRRGGMRADPGQHRGAVCSGRRGCL